MKRFILILCIICCLIFAVPAIVLSVSELGKAEETTAEVTPASLSRPDPYKITLYISETGKTETLDFEEYIKALTAAEMPPTFQLEALKAQAVAARSYILNKITLYEKDGLPENHCGALLCSDNNHCKGYVPFDVTASKWDRRFTEDYTAKFERAVSETRGEYLSYNGEAAKACFFAVSSGKTENISDVWGVSLPYLVSVDSGGDVRADGYRSRVFYPTDAFYTVLKGARPNIAIPDSPDKIFGEVTYTEGGSIATAELCGEVFKGTEIQDMFRLRSTNFSLSAENDKVVFDVKGYGHGVGMSQFGADHMASGGSGYREILNHYYPGTSVSILYSGE